MHPTYQCTMAYELTLLQLVIFVQSTSSGRGKNEWLQKQANKKNKTEHKHAISVRASNAAET